MEDMKIDSKIDYKRNRVLNGNEPHKILEMLHQKAFAKLTKR